MKLKELYESSDDNKILSLLDDYGITKEKVEVHQDGSISAEKNIKFDNKHFDDNVLPFKFKKVDGQFSIVNTGLMSLEGCPEVITDTFIASANLFKDLKHFPKKVKGATLSHNQIKNFEGVGEIDSLIANSCKIDSLKGLPDGMSYLELRFNERLTSLKDLPKNIQKLFIDETLFRRDFTQFFIKGVKNIEVDIFTNHEMTLKILRIVNKHLPNGRAGLIDCQDELIDAGFDEYFNN